MPNFTKQAIKSSFIKLLNERPLNKISVRDIVEDCGINRNSFYYHFQDIPSLIEEIISEQADNLIKEYPSIYSLDEGFRVASRFILENRKAILHIYNSVNRDIFEQYLMKMCEYVVTTYIDTISAKEHLSVQDHRIFIRLVKCECFGICIEWMNNGLNDDITEDLQRFLEIGEDILKKLLH
ncbi:MAG: TetR/AcrR family transcriptional regulator C-terminal domain-containing protein [Candidatus Howiella sp.]|jgi:AcrR family transcriptional regulator